LTTAVISDYLENKIMNHIFNATAYTTPGSTIYLALYTDATAQTDAGAGTEVTGGGYARVNVTAWDAPNSGSTANTNAITFPTATDNNWGNVRYVGITDGSAAMNLLYWGQLSADKTVNTGDTFSIAAGDLDLYLGGAISVALSGSIINHTLRATATPNYYGSGVYVGLYTADPTSLGTGTEVSGGDYARKLIADWSNSVSGSVENGATEAYTAASADWGAVSHVGLRTGLTGGELLFFGSLTAPKTVYSGDTFRFSGSALKITIS